MPAWGQTHDDEEIWNIVAFVRQLPRMTSEQYRAITAVENGGEHPGDAEHHEHAHAHGGAD
jgi:mono/diheme cytochrome c family protein